jgi:hypothetical protein
MEEENWFGSGIAVGPIKKAASVRVEIGHGSMVFRLIRMQTATRGRFAKVAMEGKICYCNVKITWYYGDGIMIRKALLSPDGSGFCFR